MATQGIKTYITGLTGFLIIRYAEVDTPTAYLGTTAPRAFPVDYTYSITNLRRVAHYFEFWQSSDGITLNQLIKKWEIDVSKQELPVIENYFYTVGGAAPTDPAPNQVQLRDARLKDKQYIVFEKGTGHLRPILDFTDRSDDGGGFDKPVGYEFQPDGEYLVTVQDKIVVDNPEPAVTGGGGISDIIIANEDNNTLDSTWYNKLILARYATGGTGILQVPALASIPDGTHLLFSTHGSSSRYLKIQFNGSEVLQFFHGKDRNWLYLGQNESLELLIKAGGAYVLDDKTGYAFVGKRIFDDVIRPNTLLRDGAIYPAAYAGRLLDWVLDLPSVQVVSFSAWNDPANQHFYAYDSASGQIRVPNSMNMYQRAVPDMATRPGTYQGDMVGPMDLQVWGGQGGSSTNTPSPPGQGLAGMDSNVGWIDGNWLIRSKGTETRGKGELLLPLARI